MWKKLVCSAVLFVLAAVIYASESIHTTFSFGSIGVTGNMAEPAKFDGGGTASVLDIRFLHRKSGLGLDFSPFNFSYYAVDGWEMSFINASVFHETFKIGAYGMFGPFAGIHWLDFQENKPVFTAGLRFRYLNELETSFNQKRIVYVSPLLFNYVTIELGALYRDNSFGVFISCKTDISAAVPLIMAFLGGTAYENTKKVYPDYEAPSAPQIRSR